MKTYQFRTKVTMKEYNHKKWWIDSGIIPEFKTRAKNITDAIKDYVEHCKECYVDISKTGLKNKSAMFIDDENGRAVQVGYVVTGATEFEDTEARTWKKQYIDLWVAIDEIRNAFAA